MTGLVAKDFVPWTAMDRYGDLVAHTSRRQKNSGFFAQKARNTLTQRVRGRILTFLFVTDLRV